MRSRLLCLVSVAALSAVALTACSSGSKAPAASGGSASGSSASPSKATAVDALALVKRAGQTSQSLKSAHLNVTTVLGGKTTTIDGDVSYRPVQLHETITVGGMTLQELLVGKSFYVQTPQTAGTKPWVTISVAKMSKLVGIDFESLLNNSRPTRSSSCCRRPVT